VQSFEFDAFIVPATASYTLARLLRAFCDVSGMMPGMSGVNGGEYVPLMRFSNGFAILFNRENSCNE